MVKAGKVRAIGVSNWAPRHIEELMAQPGVEVLPAVNQVEYHPWNQQKEIYEYCQKKKIVMVAYSPLTQGKRLGDQVVKGIGEKHGKSAAQVVLRWILQRGVVTIPKSDRESRIKENADIFDFELDEEDMGKIAELDEGQKANIGELMVFGRGHLFDRLTCGRRVGPVRVGINELRDRADNIPQVQLLTAARPTMLFMNRC